MKKFSIFMLIGAITVTLCACGNKPETKGNGNESANERFTVFSNRNVYEKGCIYTDTNSGMNYWVDYETLEAAPLCAVPNCTHNTSECVAKMVGSCPMMYNDSIYYFTSECGVNEKPDSREFYINAKLMKVNLNNSQAETITEFHDAVPDTHDGFVLDNGILYFQADDMNPQENEYGVFTYTEAGGNHFLCSIDLNSGKYTNYGSIYDDDKQYPAASSSSGATIYGVNNDNIVIDYSFLKEEIPDDKFMEEGFSMAAQFTNVVVNFNLNDKTYEITDLNEASFVDENIYVYNDRKNNIIGIIENGNEKKLENKNTSLYSLVLNGKLWTYDESEVWYDLSDLSEHTSNNYNKMIDYYNDCYIVKKRGLKFDKLTEDELLAIK